MREFQNKHWEYTVRQFDILAKKKPWSVRFRIAYMHQVSAQYSAYWRFRIFVSELLGILNLARFYLVYQRRPLRIRENQVVLLFANSTGYLHHLQPAALELVNRKRDVLLLCSAREYPILKQKLDPRLSQFLHRYESLSNRKYFIARIIEVFAAVFYAAANVLWFVFQPVKYAWQNSALFGRYAFTQYLYSRFLKRTLGPGNVIASSSDHWLWESLFFSAAKEKGVNSYFLQHGAVEDNTYPMFAQYFLAWGRQDYLKMTETFGAPESEVIVTGSPYFDRLYSEIKKSIASDSSRTYITWLSQPLVGDGYLSESEYNAVLERFYSLSTLADEYGKQLVIKLHPRGKEETYASRPRNVQLTKDSLYEVLHRSALAVTYDSTAVFESAMFAVPVIQSILRDAGRQMIYSGTGISLLAQNDDELHAHVRKLLRDKSYCQSMARSAENALHEYFGTLNGSLERIADLLTGIKGPGDFPS